MTMPDYIMEFYGQGAMFLWIVIIFLPTVYHIGHFAYRFVFDVEYDSSEHAFLRWAVDDPDSEEELAFTYIFPYVLGSLLALTLIGLMLWQYMVSLVIVSLIAMMFMARGVVRLRKALKKHIEDKEAHR